MTRKMILLDWRAMKYYQIRLPLVLVFAVMVGLWLPLLVVPSCVILLLFFSLNPFAVEEKGALNNFYLTLPVERSSIVKGRYALSAIMALSGVVFGIPVMLITNQFAQSKFFLPFDWYISILAVSYLLFALFNLLMFPILFWLGYQKGKFWGFIIPAILLGVLYGIFSVVIQYHSIMGVLEYAHNHLLIVSGGIAAIATVLLGISYALSKQIFAKRDI